MLANHPSVLQGALLALFFIAVTAGTGRAQEGKTLFGENQQETLKAMKEIAKSLGLKCQGCHLKEEGGKLNYKADTAHKRIARRMKRSLVDSLAQKGTAEILIQEEQHKSRISATYRAQGESAGIHLVLSKGDTTYAKTLLLPVAGQPLTCMTCHNGQLHFLSVETAPSTIPSEGDKNITNLVYGTGFLVSENLVVTNSHVVMDAGVIEVHFPQDTSYSAKTVRVDSSNDIAVLRIQGYIEGIPLVISSSPVRQGEAVFTLGFPLISQTGYQQAKLTTGVISSELGFRDDPRFFQVTATIQPGSSGGPLFDSSGRVIGMTTAKLISPIAENVNYAVKGIYILAVLSTILDFKPLQQVVEAVNPSPSLPDIVERIRPQVVVVVAGRR